MAYNLALSGILGWLFCTALQGQETFHSAICDSSVAQQATYRTIIDWANREQVFTYTLPPAEVVHKLLSPGAIELPWSSYPCLQLEYQFRLSSALREVGAMSEAERVGRTALALDSLLGRKMAPQLFSHMASIAYAQRDYAKAIYYFSRNNDFIKSSGNAHLEIGGYNNLGLTYFKAGDLQRAEALFEQAYDQYIRDKLPPRSLQASLLDNLADIHLLKGDTLLTIRRLHEKDSVLRLLRTDTVRMYETWSRLAQLYLPDHPERAIRFLALADSIQPRLPMLTPEHQYQLELIRFSYLQAIRNTAASIQSMHTLIQLREAAKAYYEQQHQTEVAVLHQYADYNAAQERELSLIQLEKKEQERRHQQRMTWLIALLAIIALGSGYLYFFFRNKISKQRIEGLRISVDLKSEQLKTEALEKELLQRNLEASERDVIAVSLENQRRKEWTQDIMEKLDTVSDTSRDQQQDGLRKLYNELMHETQIQDRLSLAYENEELIKHAFVNTIKSRFPDLTTTEIDLCILIRLGLTGKEIAIVRNIDPESIRKAKYRLRQKMNFHTVEDLKAYLNSISKH